MRKLMTSVAGVALLACPLACLADSSYEHTTQVTGGQLVSMVKKLSFLSKQMRQVTDPTSEITMVHGNQKAIVSKLYTEIWDLDKEQIIHIDNTQKSYSVMTFADMRKAIPEMQAKMQQMQEQMKEQQAKMQGQTQQQQIPPNLQFTPTVEVKDTGLTKMVGKYNANQQILTMKMVITDTNNPNTNVTYSFTDEIWTTPEKPSEMKEAEEFDARFAKKMMDSVNTGELMAQMQAMRTNSQQMMTQMFGSRPGAADAFAQMGKELAKIKGTRLIEITRMGGSGTGMDQAQGSGSQTQAQNGSSVAGQVATNTAQNTTSATAASATSHVGGIGGVALGSAVSGALGGVFGHKKAKTDTTNNTANNTTTTPASTSATAATPASTDVTLMEMTTNTHDFSSETIPSSVFDIPAGYKQVPSEMEQMLNKKQ